MSELLNYDTNLISKKNIILNSFGDNYLSHNYHQKNNNILEDYNYKNLITFQIKNILLFIPFFYREPVDKKNFFKCLDIFCHNFSYDINNHTEVFIEHCFKYLKQKSILNPQMNFDFLNDKNRTEFIKAIQQRTISNISNDKFNIDLLEKIANIDSNYYLHRLINLKNLIASGFDPFKNNLSKKTLDYIINCTAVSEKSFNKYSQFGFIYALSYYNYYLNNNSLDNDNINKKEIVSEALKKFINHPKINEYLNKEIKFLEKNISTKNNKVILSEVIKTFFHNTYSRAFLRDYFYHNHKYFYNHVFKNIKSETNIIKHYFINQESLILNEDYYKIKLTPHCLLYKITHFSNSYDIRFFIYNSEKSKIFLDFFEQKNLLSLTSNYLLLFGNYLQKNNLVTSKIDYNLIQIDTSQYISSNKFYQLKQNFQDLYAIEKEKRLFKIINDKETILIKRKI